MQCVGSSESLKNEQWGRVDPHDLIALNVQTVGWCNEHSEPALFMSASTVYSLHAEEQRVSGICCGDMPACGSRSMQAGGPAVQSLHGPSTRGIGGQGGLRTPRLQRVERNGLS